MQIFNFGGVVSGGGDGPGPLCPACGKVLSFCGGDGPNPLICSRGGGGPGPLFGGGGGTPFYRGGDGRTPYHQGGSDGPIHLIRGGGDGPIHLSRGAGDGPVPLFLVPPGGADAAFRSPRQQIAAGDPHYGKAFAGDVMNWPGPFEIFVPGTPQVVGMLTNVQLSTWPDGTWCSWHTVQTRGLALYFAVHFQGRDQHGNGLVDLQTPYAYLPPCSTVRIPACGGPDPRLSEFYSIIVEWVMWGTGNIAG
jgi:hypothetical protein